MILIHSLTNGGTDVYHDRFRDDNELVKDKAHVGQPDLRERVCVVRRVQYGRIPLTWQYQILEKSRDSSSSLISAMVVVGHRNSGMTPYQTFSLEGQSKSRWLVESLRNRQTEQRVNSKTTSIMWCN